MAAKLFFGRPRDRSVEAYREFILGATKALTGKADDPYTPEKWAEVCKAFWEPAKRSRRKRSGPENQRPGKG
jgi:hypothetical protein